MDSPTPVDLNKLKAILGNAKKLMAKTEEKFPNKPTQRVEEGVSNNFSSSRATPIYDERDEREPEYTTPDFSKYSSQEAPSTRDYTEEDVRNSKLPPIIKEAMLKNPIPKASMSFSKFSLEGLEDLIEKPTKKPTPQFKGPGVPLRESAGGGDTQQMITLSLPQLNEMIDNRVNAILANMFTKTITEQAIKKTVSTLINEGKLTVKKK